MFKKEKFIKKSKFLDSLTRLEKKSNILHSLIRFIKYHNAFAIGFVIVFVGFSTALAVSPELREDIIDTLVSEEQAVQSIDNNYILTADLDNFNFNLQIKEITEDKRNYYVIYTYKTITIEAHSWQEIEKEKTMTVSKEALDNKDLGLYIAEELGEVIDYELAYLKEVQTLETEKGLTQKIVTTQYAGLIGVFLNPKEKVFPGYEPVVKTPEPELIAYDSEIIQGSMTEELIDESDLEQTEIIDSSPDTIINIYPQNTTTSTEATFAFHSSDQNAFFQCKVNLEDWQNCTSPKTYSGLVYGDYTFQVFSTNLQGIYDETPAVFSWIIIEENIITDTTTSYETATTTEDTIVSEDETATSTDETIISEDETAISTDEAIATTTQEIIEQTTSSSTDEIITQTTTTSTDSTSSSQAEEIASLTDNI